MRMMGNKWASWLAWKSVQGLLLGLLLGLGAGFIQEPWVLSLSTVALAGTPPEAPALSEPLNHRLADSLRQSHLEAVETLYTEAEAKVQEALRQTPRWRRRWSPLPWVVLDLDETVLDNRAYFAHYGEYNSQDWEQWVKEAEAPALPPAVKFIHFLEQHQVPYAFVSGRREAWRAMTEANLVRLGLTGYRALYLKPDQVPHAESAVSFKEAARCQLAQTSNRSIWLLVGDQRSDLTGQCNGRYQLLVPNPIYFIP